MVVAVVWGSSALAVLCMFAVDERAHRRRTAAEPATAEPTFGRHVAADPVTSVDRTAQLVTSGAR